MSDFLLGTPATPCQPGLRAAKASAATAPAWCSMAHGVQRPHDKLFRTVSPTTGVQVSGW